MNIDNVTYQIFHALNKKLLYPANEFMDDGGINEVCEKYKFNNSFFPIPLFITAKSEDLKKMRKNILNLFYEKKIIGSIKVKKIFHFDKKFIENKIFQNKKGDHPYKKLLRKQNDLFLNAEVIYDKSDREESNKKKSMVGFATKNIPHLGHKKIILNHTAKYNKVLVAIFNNADGNYSNNSNLAEIAYNKFIRENNLRKKVVLEKIFMPAFLLGPRQASLQAIIMKNLGCDAFIVGRDHSGFKNFYKENDSYKFCKKNEKKIGIKILKSGSPFYCLKCQKVMLRTECKCWKISKKFFLDISSTFIRKINNNSELKKKYKHLY